MTALPPTIRCTVFPDEPTRVRVDNVLDRRGRHCEQQQQRRQQQRVTEVSTLRQEKTTFFVALRVYRLSRNPSPMSMQDFRDRLLPKRMISFQNRDKAFHETWSGTRDWLDIPHPFRMLLAAKPNGGKTTVVLNIILRVAHSDRPFEKIMVVHCDPKQTKEYDDIDCELREDIPAPEEFSPHEKTLCILEDLNYLNMSKEQKGRLERLYGYASTHKNVSCILTAQDPFRIIPSVRRCSNVFVLWNNHDMDMIKTLARKTGVPAETLQQILEEQCQGAHDSIWLDFTPDSPAPFRKNGYERIALATSRN